MRFRRLHLESLERRLALAGMVNVGTGGGSEDSGFVTFWLSYSGDSTGGFSVSLQSAHITTSQSDTIADTFQVNFSGTPGEVKQLQVPVFADDVVELDEYFSLTVTNISNPEVDAGEPGAGIIMNDDVAYVDIIPQQAFSSLVEGSEVVHFLKYDVKLAGKVDQNVQVHWHLELNTLETTDLLGSAPI